MSKKDSKGESNKVVTDGATLKVTDKRYKNVCDYQKRSRSTEEILVLELELQGSRTRPEAKPVQSGHRNQRI